MSNRYKLVVSYDGAAFWGWQVQPGHRTVQHDVEMALNKLTGEKVRVHGSGRTDRGVHARGQVAHFDLGKDVHRVKLLSGLNALLKEDVRILSLSSARADFHARLDAKAKEYRYLIWNGPVLSPFDRNRKLHVNQSLDIKAMAKAAKYLKGHHDFASFSANPNREVQGTKRHLYALEMRRRGREIEFRAIGDGFLYKMVRSLTGFLLRVGKGELEPKEAKAILQSGRRTAQVPTAPPQGLYLWKVHYKPFQLRRWNGAET